MSTGRSAGSPHPEVVVIGAGQAGLAIGHLLARQGRRFVILERGSDVATAWRDRWDSLTLFTPRRYDSLPGLEFPGEPDGYPTRDEVVAYLRSYAATFDLPIQLATEARSISHENGAFAIDVEDGRIVAGQIVITTGPFQQPRGAAFASALSADVVQLHSSSYRNPRDVPPGPVLVVGGGNTGFQIAEELALARHEVHLAIGSRQPSLPQRLLGRDAFWWLTKTGVIYKTADSRIGRRAKAQETLVGSSPRKAKRIGIELHARAVDGRDRVVSFDDGTELEVGAVVWATGFRSDYSWIDLPILDDGGQLRHERGVADVAGLYFLGLPWQHTRGSALLGFVKDDAAFIAERISNFATRHVAEQPAKAPA